MEEGIIWVLAVAAAAVILGLVLAAPLGFRIVEPPPHGELESPAEVVLTGIPPGTKVVARLRDGFGRILGEAMLWSRGSWAEGLVYFDIPTTPAGTLEIVSFGDGKVLVRRPVRFRDERGIWVKVFFFDREGDLFPAVRRIQKTSRVATEALRALLAGPTPTEMRDGIRSAALPGMRLISLDISRGRAEAVFSVSDPRASELELFSLQVRKTLLQFPTVTHVEVRYVPG